MEFTGSPYVPPGYRSIVFEFITPVYPQPTKIYLGRTVGIHTASKSGIVVGRIEPSFSACQLADNSIMAKNGLAITRETQLTCITSNMLEASQLCELYYGLAKNLTRYFSSAWSPLVCGERGSQFSYNATVYADAHKSVEWGNVHIEHKHMAFSYLHAVPHTIPQYPLWPTYTPPKLDAITIVLPGSGLLDFAAKVQVPVTFPALESAISWRNLNERNQLSHIPWAFGANSYTDPEWGKPDPDPEQPKPDPEPPKPDHLPSHTIMNNVQILSLPDNVPLHGTVTLDLDTDSYCWSGSLQLHGNENLPFIRPTANGPRELQITINGYQWRMFIEKYSRQRTYPAEDYTVSIASRHRQFGSPWAPLTDGAITADISAKSMLQQLLGNTGFTLTQPVNAGWIKTPDFTLRAGSYSWQAKPPIDVVSEIVDSMGAVLIPHPTADSWSLHPRYVISPWALRNAPLSAFSHIIPVGLDMQQGGEVVPQQSYNAVLISGVQFGVAVTVRRSGTAANHPAPDIYNDLHQDVQQCLEHGRNELSKSGDKELITISLPIMPTGTAPELVIPGNPVKYEHPERPSENFCGIVKRLSINVQSSFNVTQSVTIEVHTDE